MYSIIDCPAILTGENGFLLLQSKAVDVNALLIEAFGFNIATLPLNDIKDKKIPFVLSYDEFYVPENNHYHTKHFNHASLGLTILNNYCFQVIDPCLKITKAYSADKRIVNIDNTGIVYSNIRELLTFSKKNNKASNFSDIDWQKHTTYALKGINLDLWHNRIKLGDNSNIYYGLNALEYFSKEFSNFGKVTATASEFYKWIYPLVWKNDYLRRNSHLEHKKITDLLSLIIKEMEIFETNILRLKSTYKSNLHNSAIMRWTNIISLIQNYIQLEEKR